MREFSFRVCRTSRAVLRIAEISRNFGGCSTMLRKEDVAAMRMDYKMPIGFDESGLVAREPFMQFDAWFREATKTANVGEANAMILSTCGRLVVSFALISKIFAFYIFMKLCLLRNTVLAMLLFLCFELTSERYN